MVVNHSILIDLDIDHIGANMHEVVNLADDHSDLEQNISYMLLVKTMEMHMNLSIWV